MTGKYDYLVVGAGLFSAVFVEHAIRNGKTCLVVERRNEIGGNCHTYTSGDIMVHKYGAHIFRTSDERIWEYVNRFAEFNGFVNSPIAVYHGRAYNLPFNMNTFSRLWNVSKPYEAKKIIREQSLAAGDDDNLENYCIKCVGTDVYRLLVKEYTEKQWGKPCSELPKSIMKRLPVRYTYDNNYFDAVWQGVPKNGYTDMIARMLRGADVLLGVEYEQVKDSVEFDTLIYTGEIDRFYGYCFGCLEWRSLEFETVKYDASNYQGNAVVNYTGKDVPYTRSIEHKFFTPENKLLMESDGTVVSYEYPVRWEVGKEPYYPVETDANKRLYDMYLKRSKQDENVVFCGRLGEYRYYDMEDTVRSAMKLCEKMGFSNGNV